MSKRDIKSQLGNRDVTRRFRGSADERELVKQHIKLGKSPVEIEQQDRVRRRVVDLGIEEGVANEYAHNFKAAAGPHEARAVPRPKNPGLERIIGKNDLISSVFLERGAEATKSVCCIQEKGTRIGTGFLVAPRVIITNAHVVDKDNVAICRAEFNFEDRLIGEGSEKSVVFELAPRDVFFSSLAEDLDYTLVAVNPMSIDKEPSERRPITDFGFLPLNSSVANALRGECLNILQHPDGAPKRVALRQNRYTGLLDLFVHYETDTMPGSSGSPVFNDQWEVICLHHAGVPLRDADENILTVDNRIWNEDTDDPALIKWIGNEGVRISRIIANLIDQANKKYGDAWPELLAGFPREIHNPPHSTEELVIKPGQKPARPNTVLQKRVETPSATKTASSSQKSADPCTVTVTVTVGDSAPVVVKVGAPDLGTGKKDADVASAGGGDAGPKAAGPAPSNLVERGLRNLERSQTRTYFEKERDKTEKAEYYRDIDPDSDSLFDELKALVTDTHKKKLSYKVARIEHLYAWVDLQRDKKVRSIYSDERFNPKRFITEDFTIERRLERVVERRLLREGNFSPEALERMTALLEAQEPFNCEHVVPQSWFGNDAPMQGDLHHLFSCEFKCNSSRGNRPYTNFGKFAIEREANRPKCGFSEEGLFEPFMGKGKVARATLYFLVRYRGQFENMYEDADGSLATLLDWHERTPVTEHELHRNQAISDIQKNRNPFIDHPDWARIVFDV